MKIKISDVKKAVKQNLFLTNPNIKLLGLGESNINFLVDERFIVRVNGNLKDKINKEFKILKYLEKYNISPKVFVKDTSRIIIPQDYLIIEFFKGQDLRKLRLSNKMIKDLARLTSKLHSIPIIKNIPNYKESYLDVKINISKIIKLIKKYGGKKESDYLYDSLSTLKINGPLNKVSISHGDICEQNLVYDINNNLRFIDFESCGLYDSAYDIADIFTGFGKEFSKKHQNLFYEEYFKYRKDNTLKKRVEVFMPLKMFETLCWSVMHVYEIKKGIVSKEIQEKEPIKHHMNYAFEYLKKCKDLGLISNNNIKLFREVV
jgi:thiamine kinase-like enzyme